MNNPNLIAIILLVSVSTLHGGDKSPKQLLGGKPAATNTGSSQFYDGQGRFAGRSSTSGSTTHLYDGRGRAAGKVDSSKESTRVYDRNGSFSGRTTSSGATTNYYDKKGIVQRS